MAKTQGKTVAVTGAAGYIGVRLIELLQADPEVSRILAFDVREPRLPRGDKVIFDKVDVRDPALGSRFEGVDTVIHLAFVMDPIKDETRMRDINVNGTQNVFKGAGKAGVRKIIYTSSAIAYGAHPDNDVPLTEDSPLRANLDFSYAAHKLETEYVVKEFRDEYPGVIVTVFRPSIVFGKNCDNAWSHQLELPVVFSVQGHEPPMQFVHEDDVTNALHFAVTKDLDGPYNLCPRDWLEFDEIVAATGKKRVILPEPAAFAAADRMWSMGMAEAPAGYLHYVMYPWVMSPDRLEAAGFTCEHTSYASLLDTLTLASTRIRLGRSTIQRSDLRKGAIAGVGVLAGVALWRGLRHKTA